MNIISIDKSNLNSEHICCAIGNDKINSERAKTKKEWLLKRFDEGLVFKRLDQRGKVFIEYMPIENCWKPIIGKNYFLINCLWVSGQFKGKGFALQLLDECINDAKRQNKDGIIVVSSDKVRPFLTDKKFYLKHGFEIVDKGFPYFELLCLKFNKEADNPSFSDNAKKGECENKNGFTLIFSNQCPFMEEYVHILSTVLMSKGLNFKIIKLENYHDAQNTASCFGTLGIFYNGVLKAHELMTEKNFIKFVDNLSK